MSAGRLFRLVYLAGLRGSLTGGSINCLSSAPNLDSRNWNRTFLELQTHCAQLETPLDSVSLRSTGCWPSGCTLKPPVSVYVATVFLPSDALESSGALGDKSCPIT